MPSEQTTRCPYCEVGGKAESEGKDTIFAWRRVKAYELETTKTLEAIEIYCAYCHRTLSITPLLKHLTD